MFDSSCVLVTDVDATERTIIVIRHAATAGGEHGICHYRADTPITTATTEDC